MTYPLLILPFGWETFLWFTILMLNCLLLLVYQFSTFSPTTFEHHLNGLHLLMVFGLPFRYWLKIIYIFWSTSLSLVFFGLPFANHLHFLNYYLGTDSFWSTLKSSWMAVTFFELLHIYWLIMVYNLWSTILALTFFHLQHWNLLIIIY